MTIKQCKRRRNESLKGFAGTRGRPAGKGPQKEVIILVKLCSRFALIAGGTPAVPASRLTLIVTVSCGNPVGFTLRPRALKLACPDRQDSSVITINPGELNASPFATLS